MHERLHSGIDAPICPNFACVLLKTGRYFRKVKTSKCSRFETGESGFCSSKTRYGTGTAPRSKLFGFGGEVEE
jgi:hypothetical protein